MTGTSLAIPTGRTGVELVDMSDPAAPRVTTTFDTPGNARSVAVNGDLILVADGDALVILRQH